GFHALLFGKRKGTARALGRGRLFLQIVEIGGQPVRPSAVGPVRRLDLQDAEIDAHLEDVPAVARLHHPRLDHARLEFPTIERGVDILVHGKIPRKLYVASADPLGKLPELAPARLSLCYNSIVYMTVSDVATQTRRASEALASASDWCAAHVI